MSKEELTLALNEIYARYGLMFNTSSIQQYFNSKDWYVPSIKPGHFDDSQFNDYERHNVDTIVNYMINDLASIYPDLNVKYVPVDYSGYVGLEE